jgi:hypothetical protein
MKLQIFGGRFDGAILEVEEPETEVIACDIVAPEIPDLHWQVAELPASIAEGDQLWLRAAASMLAFVARVDDVGGALELHLDPSVPDSAPVYPFVPFPSNAREA